MKIAVLLTCHNRRIKTVNCLKSLNDSLRIFNKKSEESIQVEIYLTDDGCTDGTAEAACAVFPGKHVLHILQGDGNLYWAGGMRFCWKEALKRHGEWDYYLLLNDDTELKTIVFFELFDGEKYAKEYYGKEGIVSGITCSKENEDEITYGGDIWVNKYLATRKRLTGTGKPQVCDLTNANILLIPRSIVDVIGIFYEKYKHGKADFDYSNMVRRAGYPVVLTAKSCGYCEKDHLDYNALADKVIGMSLNERKLFFKNPIHSSDDYLIFVSRTSPIRVPMVWIGRMLNLYFPKLYYRMSGVRGKTHRQIR